MIDAINIYLPESGQSVNNSSEVDDSLRHPSVCKHPR